MIVTLWPLLLAALLARRTGHRLVRRHCNFIQYPKFSTAHASLAACSKHSALWVQPTWCKDSDP